MECDTGAIPCGAGPRRPERGGEIELRQPGSDVEHVADELEHVLEQIDGTDLARLARQGLDGVVVVNGEEGYETARALSVGRSVAREAMRP